MKFSQVRLLVEDFPGSYRFLRDVLGLECSSGDENDAYASFSAGTGTIAIFSRAGQNDVVNLRPAGDAALVVLEVDDVDAEARRLGDHLVEGPVTQPEWGGRVAYVRGPDGNLFELFQTIPMEEV